MIVSSGYRKNGFDAHGGKLLQKKDMDFWMNLPERTDPNGICFELSEEVEEVEQGFFELVPTICEFRMLTLIAGCICPKRRKSFSKRTTCSSEARSIPQPKYLQKRIACVFSIQIR